MALRRKKWLQKFRNKEFVAKSELGEECNFKSMFNNLLCLKCHMMDLLSQNNGNNSKRIYLTEPVYKYLFQGPINGPI